MGTIEKQGIVSILRSDSDQIKAPSLRRTLSADMSSKKWLAQSGFSPMKKIASSERLPNLVADSSSEEEEEGEDECEGKNKEAERPGRFDVWSSILLSKKADDESSKLPPPYVHPLVKRSMSTLSEKSLEICTESLGSETGSDVFSSPAPSETGDAEEDKEVQPQPESQFLDREDLPVAKNNYSKKVSTKFPPPLPSLARCDGPSLLMHSHRENGRLVLEAVSIPSQNYFHAQREDGRLVLTFANTPDSKEPNSEETIDQEEEVIDHKEDDVEEIDKIFEATEGENDSEDEEEEEEEEMVKVENEDGAKEIELVMEQATKLPSGVINVHRSALMIKKLIGQDNRNPTWTTKYNKPVHLVDMEEEEEEEEEKGLNPLAQSLPRPTRLARLIPSPLAAAPVPAAASFNTYEYFWRAKPTVATTVNPLNKNSCNKVILSNSTPKADEEQGMVLLRGNKADYLVPLLKGCKEPRRSLLLWEPYCIATS